MRSDGSEAGANSRLINDGNVSTVPFRRSINETPATKLWNETIGRARRMGGAACVGTALSCKDTRARASGARTARNSSRRERSGWFGGADGPELESAGAVRLVRGRRTQGESLGSCRPLHFFVLSRRRLALAEWWVGQGSSEG
ncbi:hypothetical protein FRACA_770007 [Frankia canadensis]|uniref:Uncharacterized protein n=1 Tax=Frankia canadensis TaxID=1836972 RepID=A0A2I2L130_9ACTN|nr:hypothetical protein FRACA_770007 [Frankia canadensis]SOU58914.1 hypothetical protein FRACA_770007 [Frankia canadensis]